MRVTQKAQSARALNSILIEKAEQAQFNAASVVACGIAVCKCILQFIAVAFGGFAQR